MITKGIVEKIIDTYTAKVRLPVYDGMPIGTISVPTDDLSSATVCTISVSALRITIEASPLY